MPMPLTNLAILIAGGGATIMLSLSGISDLQRPDVVRMQFDNLEYKDGKFVQSHTITGAPYIRAEWAAKITRDGEFLCVGGGTSIYKNGGSPPMDPSFWTGNKCPDLKAGDVAEATWEYVDEKNVRRRIGGAITIE